MITYEDSGVLELHSMCMYVCVDSTILRIQYIVLYQGSDESFYEIIAERVSLQNLVLKPFVVLSYPSSLNVWSSWFNMEQVMQYKV